MNIVVIVAGALVLAGAVGVVASRIPVHSVLALVLALLSLAALYISLDAEFLGLMQIIVYAGAVMVLFVFVINLLSATKKPLERPVDLLPGQSFVAGPIAVVLFAGVALAVFQQVYPAAKDVLEGYGSIKSFGTTMFYEHVFAVQLAALLLLVSLVGVVILIARRD